ncbi:MAG: lysophospholipid acyltransferase family protein [Actinomycetota bacterium]|nr:lysophospholipid acyltransferase family protein [Actinomycetota bacterium]
MRWVLVGFRSVATWVIGVLATIVIATAVIIVASINDTSPWIERLIRTWSRIWILASGTKLTIEGQENVDPDRSYVVVANHISTLDIMACFLAVRLPIRYLAKKELFKIPIFAKGMRSVGIIEVDRSARGAVHRQVNTQAKELIAKKRSLIIYAEGTRPRNGVMKRFKKGAFTMAIAAQLPVLPLTIHGTYEAMPPGTPWVRGGAVTLIVDAPIETTGMEHSDTGALRDEIYELISGRVRDLGGEVGQVSS